jgi:hypothetical protein
MLFKILQARKSYKEASTDPGSFVEGLAWDAIKVPFMIVLFGLSVLLVASILFGYILFDIGILRVLSWLLGIALLIDIMVIMFIRKMFRKVSRKAITPLEKDFTSAWKQANSERDTFQ